MTTQFLQAFRCADIEAGQFGHKDHVYAAWLMLRELPLDRAAVEYAECIKRIAAKFAVPGKFHATITHALMVIISNRFDASETWERFWNTNKDIANDAMSLLGVYYTKELLYSGAARSRYVPPDLKPLPAKTDIQNAHGA